jgi:hypothetical protein
VSLLAHVTNNNATGRPAFKALLPNGLDGESLETSVRDLF